MQWAHRTKDTRPPLIDFETLDGWTVQCDQAEAEFSRSGEQQLWGRYVGRLVYRGTGQEPVITLRPPKPVPIHGPFDCVNIWIYGNNWSWAPDKTTPRVEIRVLLENADGRAVAVTMGSVRWKEWWLMHSRFTQAQRDLLGDHPRFVGFQIRKGRNSAERSLYFDNLAIYKEVMPLLHFQARRRRGIELPAGQSVGNNTGPGQLPFPTRDETILPTNLTDQFQVKLDTTDDEYVFRYEGKDGELVYRYKPATGTLADVSAQWVGRGGVFCPLVGGGVRFWVDNTTSAPPDRVERLHCKREGDSVVSVWRYFLGNRSAEVTYAFRLWQKTLVVDVRCLGGEIGEFRIGKVVGAESSRLVTIPYLTGAEQRPAVLVAGPAERPLFTLPLLDHCRSNASLFWFANHLADHGATQNGGSRYLPKTDGQRNPCFERLFLTVSPRFEEVLPNIPNPKSPWMHVSGQRVWRAHGASNRRDDYARWKKVARYGMTKVVITDHETGWRDGGESFTMRTRAAPGKGGDEGQVAYARKLMKLGFRYGIYNNYTDFAPVNEYWDEDYVTRTSGNQWRAAWARCYNLKPARAVELEARLAPIIQDKFHLNTAYCDVHTAVRPWSYCDFDARVPGAGSFASTFYAYGEIMLHQKATWNGPVYSEGNNHWYYCGLTDGNYGQDQAARLDVNPWLVDFDLRKLHPLCCNFGMGNPGMFYGRNRNRGRTPEQQQARLDRFLAATLAFGHTGFLVFEGGFESAVRSYYGLQQIHARYAQQQVTSIRYADETGKLWDTSAAVASGAFRRSQIVTRYEDGLEVWVNGHREDTWKTPHASLPPNGWIVRDTLKGELEAFSCLVDGHRADYVNSPAYTYANGRGNLTRFKNVSHNHARKQSRPRLDSVIGGFVTGSEKIVCDGQLIALWPADDQVELIPVGNCSVLGVSLDRQSATARALDEAGKVIGAAKTRFSRGLVHVTPIAGAFSYVLTAKPVSGSGLQCQRVSVIPGEMVQIKGTRVHDVRVPRNASLGKQWWCEVESAWIDFTIVPLTDATLRVDDQAMHLQLTPHVSRATDTEIQLGDVTRHISLSPQKAISVTFPLLTPREEGVRKISLTINAGELFMQKSWWLKSEEMIQSLAPLPRQFEPGQCMRGKKELPLDARTKAAIRWTESACGNEFRRCLFMHPPYAGGVGYTYAVFGPVQLPETPLTAFRCDIGKGDGSDAGDGILFRVAVLNEDGKQSIVAEKQWIQHAWAPLEADLSRWSGKKIRIKLIADVGPADNSSGDWACWSNTRIESLRRVLATTVHPREVQPAREPGLFPMQGLSVARIRNASRVILHFQGIGLQNGKPYVSYAKLNGVALGPLPGAGGNEKRNVWSDAVIQVPEKGIRTLDQWNQLELENPGRDFFKVRRFWLELQWNDGRKASSDVSLTAYTQPPGWEYAEGTEVPFGKDIEVIIRFPSK